MNKFEWKDRSVAVYYHSVDTGKIIGKICKIALADVWIALAYTGQYTFTIDDERHLGQYIDYESAKKAVEHYWDVQNRTLLAGPEP